MGTSINPFQTPGSGNHQNLSPLGPILTRKARAIDLCGGFSPVFGRYGRNLPVSGAQRSRECRITFKELHQSAHVVNEVHQPNLDLRLGEADGAYEMTAHGPR